MLSSPPPDISRLMLPADVVLSPRRLLMPGASPLPEASELFMSGANTGGGHGSDDELAGALDLNNTSGHGQVVPRRRTRNSFEGSGPAPDLSGLVGRLVRRRKLDLDGERDLRQFAQV